MDPLTEEELRTELRRAILMGNIATNAGEADAEALWASVVRSIQNEALSRSIKLA